MLVARAPVLAAVLPALGTRQLTCARGPQAQIRHHRQVDQQLPEADQPEALETELGDEYRRRQHDRIAGPGAAQEVDEDVFLNRQVVDAANR